MLTKTILIAPQNTKYPNVTQGLKTHHISFLTVFIMSYSTIHLLENTSYKYLFSKGGYAYFIRTIETSEKIK